MCLCESDDWEVLFSACNVRKAGKDYHCNECGGKIQSGFSHNVHRFVILDPYHPWQREFGQSRICLCCEGDWKRILNICPAHRSSFPPVVLGTLNDHIEEAVEYGWLKPDDRLAQRWLEIRDMMTVHQIQSPDQLGLDL